MTTMKMRRKTESGTYEIEYQIVLECSAAVIMFELWIDPCGSRFGRTSLFLDSITPWVLGRAWCSALCGLEMDLRSRHTSHMNAVWLARRLAKVSHVYHRRDT
jgi:hypothetical protein